MFKHLVSGVIGAAALAIAGSASAATYVSYLEYKNDAPLTKVAPLGKVTLTEISPDTVDVVVTLFAPQVGFVNTGNGGNKAPFTFNLTGDFEVTVFNEVAGQQFVDGGYGAFQNNNFGIYTNKIDCCGGAQGGGAYDPTDLHFRVTNLGAGGLTFAGVGATIVDGKLTAMGSGPSFTSTSEVTVPNGNGRGNGGGTVHPAGFWFSADVVTSTGATFNIAARDAFVQTAIPEPGTWALMILGFGGAGAVLRRRRRLALA